MNSSFAITPAPDYDQQRQYILGRKREAPPDRDVRAFFLEAMDDKTELYVHYHAYGWPIERDVMEKLGAFDQDYDLAQHNLKLVRRFFLKRYSFCNVFKVDDLLRERGVSFLWLAKDYVVPRVGLSLLVGFALTLGAGPLLDALRVISQKPWLAVGAVAACLLLTGGLIYLMVRDRLGGRDHAIGRRTAVILLLAVGWMVLELLGVYGLSKLAPLKSFSGSHAVVTGSVALVFAVLTQFFFGRSGSMAEPI
jgi:hypothetical protein